MSRFQKYYQEVIRKDIVRIFHLTDTFDIPKLTRLRIHLMIEEIELGALALMKITNHLATFTHFKNRIAEYKIMKGDVAGCYVDLYGEDIYHLLDQLIEIVLPQQEDYPLASLDQQGNLNIGLSSLLAFIAIEEEFLTFEKLKGADINILTSTSNLTINQYLFEALGFHF